MDSVDNVSVYGDHYLVLKKDGSLWAWGKNGYSQLGDGTFVNRDDPILVYQNKK